VYMDVTRYLYDTYVQLRGTPIKKYLWKDVRSVFEAMRLVLHYN
jgi:CRISPR/Cas system CSM-associated protein Csm2 small subunit